MNNPPISIVTVCYNVVDTIEKTILSVVNQTYQNIEYIIIDGASTDGTKDIIEKYRERISYFVSEPDEGIYDAMNKGIKVATGEWIIFMNAGDIFSSETILSIFILNAKDNIGFIRGNIIRKYKKFEIISTGITNQNPNIIDMLNNTFHHQSTLIRKSLFNDYGLYSTDYKLCSDWKFFFDCTILHGIKSVYVDLPISIFSMGGTSTVNYDRYGEERKNHLYSLYGKDIIDSLYEVVVYRRFFISRWIYSLWYFINKHLNKKSFYCLVTIKRYIMMLLGKKVH